MKPQTASNAWFAKFALFINAISSIATRIAGIAAAIIKG